MILDKGDIGIMKKHYVEIICDFCGNAEHFICNERGKTNLLKDIRKTGWIITADGKHFDTKECYKNYKR